jgi:hypothetical protein
MSVASGGGTLPTTARDKKHAQISSAVEVLKNCRRNVQGLLSEIKEGERSPVKAEDKLSHESSLSEVLSAAPTDIRTEASIINDTITEIRAELF